MLSKQLSITSFRYVLHPFSQQLSLVKGKKREQREHTMKQKGGEEFRSRLAGSVCV